METYTTNNTQVRPLYRTTQVIWYIFDVIEILLLFRFVLKLLGANASAGFTSFVYGITYPFAEPFLNVFRVTRVNGATFEWTTLLAMLVYWIIAWGIVRLILMSKPVTTTEAKVKLDQQDINT